MNVVLYFSGPCNSSLERKSTTSGSVIVIGAGFAGIAAARALHDAELQVYALNCIPSVIAYITVGIGPEESDFAGHLVGIAE